MGGPAPTQVNISAARGYEVYGSIIDRHSIGDARIGVDALETFASGTIAFQRDEVFAVRGFVSRELSSGKGEWEAEIKLLDDEGHDLGTQCPITAALTDCFGLTTAA